jgi:hypothetical protein
LGFPLFRKLQTGEPWSAMAQCVVFFSKSFLGIKFSFYFAKIQNQKAFVKSLPQLFSSAVQKVCENIFVQTQIKTASHAILIVFFISK